MGELSAVVTVSMATEELRLCLGRPCHLTCSHSPNPEDKRKSERGPLLLAALHLCPFLSVFLSVSPCLPALLSLSGPLQFTDFIPDFSASLSFSAHLFLCVFLFCLCQFPIFSFVFLDLFLFFFFVSVSLSFLFSFSSLALCPCSPRPSFPFSVFPFISLCVSLSVSPSLFSFSLPLSSLPTYLRSP